jgi:hypothetical protein
MLNVQITFGQTDAKNKKILGPVELKFEPTYTIENFVNAPQILTNTNTKTPITVQTGTESVFEMIFSFGIETAIPRVGLTFETMWKPFAKTDKNLFTGSTASRLGSEVKDNFPEIEAEVNFSLFTFDQTKGWADAHFDVVDKFSPAKRPDAKSSYTHKLNLEMDVAFGVFHWLKDENYLREVELEVSFDYVATGLPKKGDVFPELGIEYLDNASPWSVSFLMVFPIAPLKFK